MSRILWILFNKSLDSGIFPSTWKTCLVFPIFKGGVKTLANSYRPISLQNVMPKLLESIITAKLSFYCKNLIINQQHGFVSGRSTITNLLPYQRFLSDRIEEGLQVDAVYADLRKAFDSVNHPILFSKLCALGVHGNLVDWLSSYITDRTQIVKINDCLSKGIAVRSGAPQGSHLGPLLFILFINDISDVFMSSRFCLFADDLKIYRPVTSVDDAVLLQRDLERLTAWCSINKLYFNVSKCHIIRFSRSNTKIIYPYSLDNTSLSSVNTIRDLGILFSDDLSFHAHYLFTANSAFKALGFIYRCSLTLILS